MPGVRFVIALDFGSGHQARTWNRSVKVIGVSGAKGGNGPAGLGPGGGVQAVRVDNPAHALKSAIQNQVRVRVGARLESALNDAASLELDDNHVPRLHFRVRNS